MHFLLFSQCCLPFQWQISISESHIFKSEKALSLVRSKILLFRNMFKFCCKENSKWNALPERIRSLSFQPSRGVAAGWNWAYSEKKKKWKVIDKNVKLESFILKERKKYKKLVSLFSKINRGKFEQLSSKIRADVNSTPKYKILDLSKFNAFAHAKLTLYSTDTRFDASTLHSFWKHCEKRRNCS